MEESSCSLRRWISSLRERELAFAVSFISPTTAFCTLMILLGNGQPTWIVFLLFGTYFCMKNTFFGHEHSICLVLPLVSPTFFALCVDIKPYRESIYKGLCSRLLFFCLTSIARASWKYKTLYTSKERVAFFRRIKEETFRVCVCEKSGYYFR